MFENRDFLGKIGKKFNKKKFDISNLALGLWRVPLKLEKGKKVDFLKIRKNIDFEIPNLASVLWGGPQKWEKSGEKNLNYFFK